jgi:ParB family transcriptional regulator, chromosome partitioning protein
MTKKSDFASMDLLTTLDKKKVSQSKIRIDQIEITEVQPRIIHREKVDDLLESIQKLGMIEPIVVRKTDSCYLIVAGERRFRAAKLLGWEDVPAIVLDVDADQSYEIALAENEKRKNLNPWEVGRAIRYLREEKQKTAAEVADILGYTPRYIKQLSSIARLSVEDIEELTESGTDLSIKNLQKLLKAKESEGKEPILPDSATRVNIYLGKLSEQKKYEFLQELIDLKRKYGLL